MTDVQNQHPSPLMLVAAVRAGIAIDPDEPTDVMITLERNALAALDSLYEQIEAYESALRECWNAGQTEGFIRKVVEAVYPAANPASERGRLESLGHRTWGGWVGRVSNQESGRS